MFSLVSQSYKIKGMKGVNKFKRYFCEEQGAKSIGKKRDLRCRNPEKGTGLEDGLRFIFYEFYLND